MGLPFIETVPAQFSVQQKLVLAEAVKGSL
jgi:hypothetical protein